MCRETWREDPAERVRKAVANFDLCILSSFFSFFLMKDPHVLAGIRDRWRLCVSSTPNTNMSRCIRGYGELQSRREFYGI